MSLKTKLFKFQRETSEILCQKLEI